ncbi:Inhibitor of growth proteins N-terminal histone-binding family protein [Theileria parva strain Muguga]|uniref:Inhibitor of growth protein N-terminal histone-binding domain-containing protein n=1 Tax=Theileria parva TaxID=5875 RepID=Q4N8W6_THEPA|nr:Inhibitor of growth proteins N-terminal histone-binding family protein [Theileria parva strain Muguga]EAN33592.1 Inhibitor of growth proteins N-terminal histone-binding family protein [Theileria parva strain Muguga]|eukprot:XP_765875.1 hypothetical protein [Theileria parva strain Muguga]
MDNNINDITDELLCLPGYVRRNLLLIRDLDLKSTSLFNEANKLSQNLFNVENNKKVDAKTKKVVENHKSSAIANKALFDDIQNLRIKGIYYLQEKIDLNTQITTMLKYEYENLKSKFDQLYSDMELKGQLPHDLKLFTNNKGRTFLYNNHLMTNGKENATDNNAVDALGIENSFEGESFDHDHTLGVFDEVISMAESYMEKESDNGNPDDEEPLENGTLESVREKVLSQLDITKMFNNVVNQQANKK